MSLTTVLFRLTFVLFVVVYISVLAEFVNPQFYNVDFRVDIEALILTLIVGAYVFFFFRKTR